MMVRSGSLAGSTLAFCLALVCGPSARAEEPARWTPDVASVDQSIREALADRNSQTAGVFFYRPGYFPYRAFYRPYYGVGYSYFPASYYVAPSWGFNYYAGYPYSAYYPSYTYASFYAPYSYAPYPYTYAPAYYAPAYYAAPAPVLYAAPGYCGCYYW